MQQVSERLESEVGGLKRKLEEMMASSMEGQSATIGSFTFKSPRDVEVLFGVEGKEDPQISHCWDLFAALENMVSKGHDGKEWSDERHSASRTLTTVDESSNMATMDYVLPTTLFSKTGQGGRFNRSDGLEACPTYEKWLGNGRDSFQHEVHANLSGFTSQATGSITCNGPGAMLGRALCNNKLFIL